MAYPADEVGIEFLGAGACKSGLGKGVAAEASESPTGGAGGLGSGGTSRHSVTDVVGWRGRGVTAGEEGGLEHGRGDEVDVCAARRLARWSSGDSRDDRTEGHVDHSALVGQRLTQTSSGARPWEEERADVPATPHRTHV